MNIARGSIIAFSLLLPACLEECSGHKVETPDCVNCQWRCAEFCRPLEATTTCATECECACVHPDAGFDTGAPEPDAGAFCQWYLDAC